tara:strand:+ start:86 stop:304 length:219 start_codon:yes stop_codon:yes gene_type:complete
MYARPTTFAFAEKIGTEIPRVGTTYCEDDNTYTEYTFFVKAWACPVALRTELTCARPYTADELFDAMFGDDD